MYDNFKVANYNNALLSPELFARHLSRFLSGDVIDGLTATPGTGLQVILQPGNALVRYGAANVASARLVSLVDTFALAVGTPDASNPRIDSLVVYVDTGVTLASPTLDGAGVGKAMLVQGTPNANPVAPNAAAIQAAVGASNPYTVVDTVRVDAGVSVIGSDKIADVRSLVSIGTSRLGDTGWKSLTAISPFSAQDNLSVRKIGNVVHIHGSISRSSGSSTTYTDALQLPSGFYPASDQQLAIPPGASTAFWAARISASTGRIMLSQAAASSAWANFGGLSWCTD